MLGYIFALAIAALFAILFIYWGIQLWKIGNAYGAARTLSGKEDTPSPGWAKAGAVFMWLSAIGPVITSIVLLIGGLTGAAKTVTMEQQI